MIMPKKKELSMENLDETPVVPDVLDAEGTDTPLETQAEKFSLVETEDAADPVRSDRQKFYALKFNELDRHLTSEERQEWNSIYASYRGRSSLSGTIIGIDRHTVKVWNRETEENEVETMYCAIVVPYRVRIVIPATEMWDVDMARPDFVLQNMVGAKIDFIIIKVEREAGFAIASRRLASRAKRYYFSQRSALHGENAHVKCRVLAVGPRRCLVDCYGHDINITQREMRYAAIPDLRNEYHPGMELDCIVKAYDPKSEELTISVKETESNPFDGANIRHPEGSRRMATIAGKYGGGVFCNLPDGTVCMCNYSYQHEDSEFMMGDTVILVVQSFDMEKKQMYGKILSRW
jgi:ribosomal protein S1